MGRKVAKPKKPTTATLMMNEDQFIHPAILLGDHPTLGTVAKVIRCRTTPPVGALFCEQRSGPHFMVERIIGVAGGIVIAQGYLSDAHGDYCARLITHVDADWPDPHPWMPVKGPIDPESTIADYVAFIMKGRPE